MSNSISNNNEKLNVKQLKTEIMSTKKTKENLVNNSTQSQQEQTQTINKMKNNRKLIGHIGVDSGTVWVGDPCYILHDKNPKSIGKNWSELCDKTFKNNECQLPISFNYDMGHKGLGIMSQTKYGDGTYPVYMIGDNDGIYIEFN